MDFAAILKWVRSLPPGSLLGIQGPQGAGKSALARALVGEIPGAVCCSLDDFYLRREEQQALAGHRLLEHRGYPGTHDLPLLYRSLSALKMGHPLSLPTYDKSAFGGRGDRSPLTRPVAGPYPLVILEGWMVGFRCLKTVEPDLERPNKLLLGYMPLWDMLDATLLLESPDFSQIIRWRMDSERARRERGETALSEAKTLDYILRFEPAYRSYLPELLAVPEGPHRLRVPVGPERLQGVPLG